MHICKDVGPQNNCCSETDEIILFKSWMKFTEPKLHRNGDEIISQYSKFFHLSAFIKAMNPKMISYHTEKYIWKKEEKKKCFDAQYFVTEKKI